MHLTTHAAVEQHDQQQFEKLDSLSPPVCSESLSGPSGQQRSLLPPGCHERIQDMLAPDHLLTETVEHLNAALLDSHSPEQRKEVIARAIRKLFILTDDHSAKSLLVLNQERTIGRLMDRLDAANAELLELGRRVASEAEAA